MKTILFLLVLGLPIAYLACLWSYGRFFFTRDEPRQNLWARLGLAITLFMHFGLLSLLAIQHHRCPLWTQGEALLFLAWMLAIIHLISEWSANTKRLGFFTLGPVALCTILALFFLGKDLVLSPQYRSSWFIFHILASLAAYACYSLTAVLAGVYLLLHRKLKRKTFDIAFRKLPPLDQLDKLAASWSFMGTLMMLASSFIGALWVRQDSLSRMGIREIGIFLVLILFLSSSITRRLFGWRGRRHAQLVLISYTVLLVVNLLGIHGFSL